MLEQVCDVSRPNVCPVSLLHEKPVGAGLFPQQVLKMYGRFAGRQCSDSALFPWEKSPALVMQPLGLPSQPLPAGKWEPVNAGLDNCSYGLLKVLYHSSCLCFVFWQLLAGQSTPVRDLVYAPATTFSSETNL